MTSSSQIFCFSVDFVPSFGKDLFMMTSRHGYALQITGPFVRGMYLSPADLSHNGSVMRLSFNVFFVIGLTKLFNKHTGCSGYETTWRYNMTLLWRGSTAGPRRAVSVKKKDRLSIYRDSLDKGTPVVGPSYFYQGSPYIAKTASIYWDGPKRPVSTCDLMPYRKIS